MRFSRRPERSIVPLVEPEIVSRPEQRSWWRAYWFRLLLGALALVLVTVLAVLLVQTYLLKPLETLDKNRVLLYEGHYTLLSRQLRETVIKTGADYDNYLLLGRSNLSLLQAKTASNYLSDALKLRPNEPEAIYWLGRALLENGNIEQAEQTINFLLNNSAFRGRALATLGEIRYRQNRFDEAGRFLYEALKAGNLVEPLETYRTGYLYGVILLGDTRFSDAREQFRRTTTLKLDSHWQNNAALLWYISKYNERIRQITSVLPAENAGESEAARRTKAGYALLAGEEFALAEEQFVRVLQLTPDFVDAQAYLASIYWRTGRVLQAQNYLYAVLKKDPDNRFARQVFVQLLIDQLQRAQPAVNSTEQVNKARDFARELLDGLMKERPEDPLLQVDLARYYIVQGRYSEAEAAYFKALELYEKKPVSGINIQALLLQFYTEIGVDPCGRGGIFAERIIKDFPQDSESWYWAGLSSLLCNKSNLAITRFEKALELRPNWPLAIYRMGLAYQEIGDKDNASRYLDMANDIEPSNRWIRFD
jgi:tetratricopeptide (TPR) repeat protein